MQVLAIGDLVNWMISGKMVKGMGGTMDLVHVARTVYCDDWSKPPRTTLPRSSRYAPCPLTGARCVNRTITDLVVIDVCGDGLHLIETATQCTGRRGCHEESTAPGAFGLVDPVTTDAASSFTDEHR
ncbi:hypothetical protein [Mycobacterium leprae]|uniref:hypothetical protein n=1 Tax=Mycobacterium leprae TaxID=1769 RepID=UPI0039BED8EC